MNPLLELRDIHAPGIPGLWPPAPGWWLLGLLVLIVLFLLARQLLRLYRRYRRRRAAFAALRLAGQRLEGDVRDLAAELSVLLRRVALSRFPRREVAALSGDSWLQFLDETGGGGRFSEGPGRVLTSAPYQPVAQLNPRELYELVRDWVHKNA